MGACEEGYQPSPGDLSITAEVPGKGPGKGKGKDKGKMMAMAAEMGMPPEAMMQMMKGKGGKGPYGGGGGGGGKKPQGTGQFLAGTVKSFNAMQNYGFISSDDVKTMYGSDVFCGGNDLANFQPGTQ